MLSFNFEGWMLPGAEIGIRFYIYPDLSRLSDIQVWKDAASKYLTVWHENYKR